MSDAAEKHGRLTLLETYAPRGAGKPILALWRCDCGAEKVIARSVVRTGRTQSCGCYGRERYKAGITKHGMHRTPTYSSWQAMLRRCNSPKRKEYPRWGGRGVTVCAAWAGSFEAFLADMGERPPGKTLDRIDNSRGYEPGNCRWATPKEQARNRRSTLFVVTEGGAVPVTEYAERTGLSPYAVRRRIANGKLEGVRHG